MEAVEPEAGRQYPGSPKSECPGCGMVFGARRGKLYCSRSCKRKASDKRRRTPVVFGEGDVRPDNAVQCPCCRSYFLPRRASQLYCGLVCQRKMASRARYIPSETKPETTQVEKALGFLRQDPTLTSAQLLERAGLHSWAVRAARDILEGEGESEGENERATSEAPRVVPPLMPHLSRLEVRRRRRENAAVGLSLRLRQLCDLDARDAASEAEFEAALEHVRKRRAATKQAIGQIERRLGTSGDEA